MSDTFRKEYKKIEPSKVDWMNGVKEKAQELYDLINPDDDYGGGRELAIARTNLEQSVMWAIKGITG